MPRRVSTGECEPDEVEGSGDRTEEGDEGPVQLRLASADSVAAIEAEV